MFTRIQIDMLFDAHELALLDSEVAHHNAAGGQADRAAMLAILLGVKLSDVAHERRTHWRQRQQYVAVLARHHGFTVSSDDQERTV